MSFDPTASEDNLGEGEFHDDFAAEDLGSKFSVTDGEHTATVVGIEDKVSKQGNPMYMWSFLIKEGKREVEIRDWTVRTKDQLWKLGKLLSALGIPVIAGRIRFSRKSVVGKRLIVKTKNEEYEGRASSKVQDYKPHPKGPTPGPDEELTF